MSLKIMYIKLYINLYKKVLIYVLFFGILILVKK